MTLCISASALTCSLQQMPRRFSPSYALLSVLLSLLHDGLAQASSTVRCMDFLDFHLLQVTSPTHQKHASLSEPLLICAYIREG
jgi:hypothetical protein